MTKICKNCKYFKYTNDGYHPTYQGECENSHFTYTGDGENVLEDGLGYWDYESYSAGFNVGEKFGCVHFKRKEQ